MNSKSILCFGEVMLRVAAPKGMRLEQTLPGSLSATFGGSEANVAVSLARFGTEAIYVSAMPLGPFSEAFSRELRGNGIQAEIYQAPNSRFGLYFVEHGSGLRSSVVHYDRSETGVAQTSFDAYCFDSLLERADAVHISGITPAISRMACEATLRLVRLAKKRGLFVSCDLNYRSKLWNWDEQKSPRDLAREWMPQIVEHVDLLVGNESDFSDMLEIEAGRSNPCEGKINPEDYASIARVAAEKYSGFRWVASSLRESLSADVNRWGGLLFDVKENALHLAPLKNGEYVPYELQITDRFGAGDAFAGGLLHALLSDDLSSPGDAIRFAVAAGALKHSVYGDYNQVSKNEVIQLMQGDQSGRVKR